MGCKACERAYEDGNCYPYRWQASRVVIVACQPHAKEIINALNRVQNDHEPGPLSLHPSPQPAETDAMREDRYDLDMEQRREERR